MRIGPPTFDLGHAFHCARIVVVDSVEREVGPCTCDAKPVTTASNEPTAPALTLADIERLRARLKPCRFPFMAPGKPHDRAVLVVATDEQIAQADISRFLRRVTDESDTP